ncbi:MAG TPA: hypothetical protein VFC39_14775 [Acidobacteriaceae bacterium]|nr:hypothetical protein [Acidobacteriaceae bacterium]
MEWFSLHLSVENVCSDEGPTPPAVPFAAANPLVPHVGWVATCFPALLLIGFGGVNVLGNAFSGRLWLGMALMAMCGALLFGTGGEICGVGRRLYLPARGFGDRVAVLYGWMSTVAMYPGVAASLAVGSAAYVAVRSR